MKLKTTETALVRSCLDFLALKGIVAWRNNTQGVFDPVRGRFRTFTGRKGVSDILGIMPLGSRLAGRLIAVECKIGRNVPSKEQHAFLADVKAHGGIALVVYSVDELIIALNRILLKESD